MSLLHGKLNVLHAKRYLSKYEICNAIATVFVSIFEMNGVKVKCIFSIFSHDIISSLCISTNVHLQCLGWSRRYSKRHFILSNFTPNKHNCITDPPNASCVSWPLHLNYCNCPCCSMARGLKPSAGQNTSMSLASRRSNVQCLSVE